MQKSATSRKTLEQYRDEFKQKKLLAMPISGTIVWLILGIMALYLPSQAMVLPLYIGTGSIFYLALFISKFTNEQLIAKKHDKNPFDMLFLSTVIMSLLVFAIVIPLAQENYMALPMAIGIMTGIMWLPLSWIIEHKVGIYHAVTRTLALLCIWYLAPEQSFVLVPFAIVLIYLVSLVSLYKRWLSTQQQVVGNAAQLV